MATSTSHLAHATSVVSYIPEKYISVIHSPNNKIVKSDNERIIFE